MRQPLPSYEAVVEPCPETGLLVGYVPGIAGAHSQGRTRGELRRNLQEVLALLADDDSERDVVLLPAEADGGRGAERGPNEENAP